MRPRPTRPRRAPDNSESGLPGPRTTADGPVHPQDLPRSDQHQPDSQFSDGRGVRARGRGDANTEAARGVDVNVVGAGAEPDHDLQARCGEDLFGNLVESDDGSPAAGR